MKNTKEKMVSYSHFVLETPTLAKVDLATSRLEEQLMSASAQNSERRCFCYIF
jgi:hypothetical protein